MQSIIDIIAGWCVRENKSPIIASAMLTEYNSDIEYWSNLSLWKLFDYVCESELDSKTSYGNYAGFAN